MNIEKVLPLTKGIVKKLFLKNKFDHSTGGTNNSRYCYSVWMRHIVMAYNNGIKNLPSTIAELGPGDSLGIGFTALLTGIDRCFTLDVHKYWDIEKNLRIFDELVLLLKNRIPIPGDHEFTRITPSLPTYEFPHQIFPDQSLEKALSAERINSIRNEILNLGKTANNHAISYFIPWNDREVIKENSVDFIFSQAVLQYVDDLDATYECMHRWLKKGGFMSHSIDFSSHGITKSWNGHWLFSDAEWKLIHGNKQIVLNREPRSTHVRLHDQYQFEILYTADYTKESLLSNRNFSKKFKSLIPKDISTNIMVILARKMFGVTLLSFSEKILNSSFNMLAVSLE